MREITIFLDAAGVMYRGSWASKSYLGPKNMDYSPGKRSEIPEITSFQDAAGVLNRGSRGIEILPGPKNMDYSPRKPSEMPEITMFHDARNHELTQKTFTMPLKSSTGGHGASKSSWDPKNVDYS